MSHSIIHDVSRERRKAIVSRGKGGPGVTQVTAAECTDEAELAFAIRFLMDHFTYKRSKGEGVNAAAIQSAASALRAAVEAYKDEVAAPMGVSISGVSLAAPAPKTPVVSELGSGKVRNPFDYINA